MLIKNIGKAVLNLEAGPCLPGNILDATLKEYKFLRNQGRVERHVQEQQRVSESPKKSSKKKMFKKDI